MQLMGVIGAGQMGSGIAQVAAQAGYHVLLSDREMALAVDGKSAIADRLGRAEEKGRLQRFEAEAILSRITPVADYSLYEDVFLAIEAATENEGIKRRIFEELGLVLGTHAVLATNTSSIPITRLAQAAPDAARFIGVHFFNPVPVMKPVELIRGLKTSDETVLTVKTLQRRSESKSFK